MNVVFKPHPGPQTEVLQRLEKEILFGGSRGGGKSTAMTCWMVEPKYIENPLYRGLVIRRNYTDLRDWIDKAKEMYRYLGVSVVGNPAEFRFESGAKIRTGHLTDTNAWQSFLGHEYQKMGIEELTLIDSEELYLRLISSARSTIEGLEPQIFCTTNPGGPGHHWVKERFVDKARNKTYIDDRSGNTRIFIPSKIYDNPTLIETDPGYLNMLKELPEELKKAWLEGDWEIFAGQFFTSWRHDVHVVEPFEIPSSWRRYRCVDYGFTNPFACLWATVDHDGNVYLYREHYEKGKELNHHINRINELTGDEDIFLTICDPAMWIRNPQNSTNPYNPTPSVMSIADIMLFNGIPCIKANNDRINGWNNMREYLHWTEEKSPKLRIFNNCKETIRTIPVQVHDEHRVEDVNTKGEDHIPDAIRYLLMHLGRPDMPLKPRSDIEKLIDSLDGDGSGDFIAVK